MYIKCLYKIKFQIVCQKLFFWYVIRALNYNLKEFFLFFSFLRERKKLKTLWISIKFKVNKCESEVKSEKW